jgi:tetraacyldisaccharide 4'-kinase
MDVNYHWYRSSYTPLTFLLLPFASVFRVIVSLRRALYRFGFKKTQHFDVPVIVVGNITVGGTGKTPFVIWLVNFLRAQGYRHYDML